MQMQNKTTNNQSTHQHHTTQQPTHTQFEYSHLATSRISHQHFRLNPEEVTVNERYIYVTKALKSDVEIKCTRSIIVWYFELISMMSIMQFYFKVNEHFVNI